MTFSILSFLFGAAALIMVGRVLHSQAKKSPRCATCGEQARYMAPYFMCDTCKNMIGVRIGETNYF
jgi:hypothetical protein